MTRRNNILLFEGVDRVAVLLYMLLTAIGFFAVMSASWDSSASDHMSMSFNYMKQLVWIGISWLSAFVILLLDRSIWHKYAYLFYVIGIVALLLTLFAGKTVNGAKAWFVIGSMRIQPMEFAKIAIALATARIMSAYSFSLDKAGDLFHVAVVILLPLGIVVAQNDTGSGMVLGSFLFMMYREGLNNWLCIPILIIAALFIISFLFTPTALLVALIIAFILCQAQIGGRWKICLRLLASIAAVSFTLLFLADIIFQLNISYYSVLLTTSVCASIWVLYRAFRTNTRSLYIMVALFYTSIMILPTSDMMFNALREHQQKRIISFLGVVNDPKEDYNVNQSKIAIGSGGFFGKGYLEGSQIKYGFVPERHTDFIFCTIGEEEGFVGCIVVLAVMMMFILRLMKMGDAQQEAFGRVYCYCVASIFLFHTLVNVGMTIGIVPVMGIPLPFISYGGSSLLAFTIMVFIAFSLDASTKKSIRLRY